MVGQAWGELILLCRSVAPEARGIKPPLGRVAELALLPPCEEIDKILASTLTLAALLKEVRFANAITSALSADFKFAVLLTGSGDKKIEVIKVVRELAGLGLQEAKELVEGPPMAIRVVKEGVSKAEAAEIQKKIEEAGGSVAPKYQRD